jgi:SdrD B-like domain/FlgD Ig-like domain
MTIHRLMSGAPVTFRDVGRFKCATTLPTLSSSGARPNGLVVGANVVVHTEYLMLLARGRVVVATAALTGAALVTTYSGGAHAAGSSAVTGHVWQDTNRNGVIDSGEAPFTGQMLMLFNASGANVASGQTGTDGSFSFGGLADGTYTVKFGTQSWWNLRSDWVPTTTGSLYYTRTVTVAGTAVADIGLRQIVRSTDVNAPLSTYSTPNGISIRSFDDALTAQDIWTAMNRGTLFGPESALTTIYFDYGTQTDATWSVSGNNGTYSGFHANMWIAYLSWLDNTDEVLFHEYGHDWGNYNAEIVQQDDTYASYLKARGLYGDPRLFSSKAWDPNEMLAEDYRQLFGSPNAAVYPQANTEIPPAAQVSGLRAFLQNTYTQPQTATPPNPSPTPSPSPTVAPVSISGLTVNPQPISSTGTIAFSLSSQATTTVDVVSSSGALVRRLLAGVSASGTVSTKWDRKDSSGHRVKSGNYTLKVTAVDDLGNTATATAPAKVS